MRRRCLVSDDDGLPLIPNRRGIDPVRLDEQVVGHVTDVRREVVPSCDQQPRHRAVGGTAVHDVGHRHRREVRRQTGDITHHGRLHALILKDVPCLVDVVGLDLAPARQWGEVTVVERAALVVDCGPHEDVERHGVEDVSQLVLHDTPHLGDGVQHHFGAGLAVRDEVVRPVDGDGLEVGVRLEVATVVAGQDLAMDRGGEAVRPNDGGLR